MEIKESLIEAQIKVLKNNIQSAIVFYDKFKESKTFGDYIECIQSARAAKSRWSTLSQIRAINLSYYPNSYHDLNMVQIENILEDLFNIQEAIDNCKI